MKPSKLTRLPFFRIELRFKVTIYPAEASQTMLVRVGCGEVGGMGMKAVVG